MVMNYGLPNRHNNYNGVVIDMKVFRSKLNALKKCSCCTNIVTEPPELTVVSMESFFYYLLIAMLFKCSTTNITVTMLRVSDSLSNMPQSSCEQVRHMELLVVRL